MRVSPAGVLLLVSTALSTAACYDDERLVGAIADARASTAGAFTMEPESLGPFGPPRLIAELSDPDRDLYDAALSADKLQILFRAEPRRSPGTGRSEILRATRSDPTAAWGAPQLVEAIDAPDAWNLAPELSLDGLNVWLSSDRFMTVGGLDLWVSSRPDPLSSWSAPDNIAALNTEHWDTDAGIDTSQRSIVFSRRADGGDAELFSSARLGATEPWQPAEQIQELSSPADEWDAAFAKDGLCLFFASNRSDSTDLFALHLYQATRTALDQPFSGAVLIEELAAPGATDEDPWFSNDARHVVWTSTRGGRRQLYEAFR